MKSPNFLFDLSITSYFKQKLTSSLYKTQKQYLKFSLKDIKLVYAFLALLYAIQLLETV